MSLRGQFFLSVILALALGLALENAVAVWHVRRSVANEMHKALEAGDHVVDNALVSLPLAGRDTYLSRLVTSFDDNRHVRVRLLAGAQSIAVSRIAQPDPVPDWFSALLGIPSERRMDSSPRLANRTLLVETDPRNETAEAWGQLRDSALILALFSLAVLGLLHLALVRMAAPLQTLIAGFDAVGSGDYAARAVPRGPRELSYLARAFNRMAERLGALESANRRMAGQMQVIQEEERADLARDLHDEMGPFLFAVRVDAEAIAKAGADTPAILTRAQAIAEAVRHIQGHVRAILTQLRPGGEVGPAQAIVNLASFWQRHHPDIAIALDIDPAAADGLGAEIDAAIFRLVQEGLTNAARHSSAAHVWVTLKMHGSLIRLIVEDDGIGFGPAKGGMGLVGMRERLASLSGGLALETRPGGGARLVAEIPCRTGMGLRVPA